MNNYWYFATSDLRLRYGDGRLIEVGVTHKVEGELKLCYHGLHASARAIDALNYAPGPIACQVKLGGEISEGNDKVCASERTYLSVMDASEVLREFSRLCALDVIHLWDAPEVIVRYLKTGDESIRDAAWNAIRDGAWSPASAAWCAAYAAGNAVRAEGSAAGNASNAAKNAARAWYVARYTSRDAARYAAEDAASSAYAAQNERLEKMLLATIHQTI